MAAKDNASASDIDKTSFWFTGLCGICHPGGGPSEFDRDGHRYFDAATQTFGYEQLGRTAADVELDGDYCEVSNANGSLRAAPWNVTGVAEPDCLLCHRADRTVAEGKNMNWIWRTATLRAKDKLVDGTGASVPAFASAATAAQGWFRGIQMASVPAGSPPMAASLDIDYGVGLADGSLVEDLDGHLRMAPSAIAGTPPDFACWGCHVTPDMKKRGRAWFDPAKDVHYAAFNHLDDEDAGNDVPAGASTACTQCHPSGMDHDIAKGNATLGSVRNDTDYVGFRTCRDCHLPGDAKHPAAPAPTSPIHTIASSHLRSLSCEFCHIPYKSDPADLAIDNATTGATIAYPTSALLSADPLDPTAADTSRWYPSFAWKTEHDGVRRLFPVKLLLSAWWGDWDDAGTPSDLTDDVIRPIPLWRIRQVTAGAPLPGTTDDNGDGKVEVNRPQEIQAYITAFQVGTDRYGRIIAARPVLVVGGRVWHASGGGVTSFEYHGTGIETESSHPFSVNHNVLPASQALGANACSECHVTGQTRSPVFDRLIPVAPFDGSAQADPVYKTVRLMTGLDPH